MKRFLVFLFTAGLFIGPGTLFGQQVKELPLRKFTQLQVSGAMEIQIIQGNTNVLVAEGDEEEIAGIMANVDENGVLSIRDKSNGKGGKGTVLKLYCESVEVIRTAGAMHITIQDSLRVPKLMLDFTGATEMDGWVKTDQLLLNTSGASEVRLCGTTHLLKASLSGASELYAGCLEADLVQIRTGGASEAEITVKDSLWVDAMDASDITYNGEPPFTSIKTSGASEVNGSGSPYGHIAPPPPPDDIAPVDTPNYDRRHRRRMQNDWKDRFDRPFRFRQDLVWMGIDLGVNGYVDKDFNFQPQGDYDFMELNYLRSSNVRLNFFEWRFNIAKNVLNIVTGMGFEWYHYAFNRPIRFAEAVDYPGQVFPTPVIGVADTVHAISRSRLVVQNFCIPLFINLRSKKTDKHRQQFNFSFGVVGAVRIGSNSRVTYTEQGEDVRDKNYDDFNLNLFSATAMVRIKYSFFSMYVSYMFTPMFKNDNPGLRPISIGVTLLSF